MTHTVHGQGLPSEWLLRWQHLLPDNAHVLDVACGAGRHTRHLLSLGHQVTAVDRDAQALAHLQDTTATCLLADLEQGDWPFEAHAFDAVVVTNYLWRPVFAHIISSLKPGGFLVFETFAIGQETIGKPSRAAFLLAPGEALHLCAPLHVVAFENGFEPATPESAPRYVQRIVATKLPGEGQPPTRHVLRT